MQLQSDTPVSIQQLIKQNLAELEKALKQQKTLQISTECEIINYDLVNLIQTGSEAVVFKAYSYKTQSYVTLRFNFSNMKFDENSNINLQLKYSNHPNIQTCNLITNMSINEWQVDVMEFEYVQYCLENICICKVDVPSLVYQLCYVVNFLQSHNIVHRDIKLQNILIDEKKQNLKLTDFGFCRQIADQLMPMIGSPAYMPPEALDEQMFDEIEQKSYACYDQKFDNWSIGVVMYQLYQNRLPFQTQNETVHKQLDINRDFDQFDDQIMVLICYNLLHKDAEKRMRLDDVLFYLEQFLQYQNNFLNKNE